MRAASSLLCCLLVYALVPAGAMAAGNEGLPRTSPEQAGLASSWLEQITPLLQAYVERGEIAGAVAGVARHGQLAYLESVGWQDLEQQQPMSTDSIFQIRSMSKPVTAVAALQLIEQGSLGLQDPVSRYIPRFGYMFVLLDPDEPFLSAERKPSREITIEDLLLNTAGLSHRNSPLYQQRRVRSRGDNLGQLVNKVAGVPLIGDPGAQWVYSISLTVLGRVVEIVSGEALDDYLASHVYGPLGMQDTAFFVAPEQLPRLTAVYNMPTGDQPLRREAEMDVPITQDPPLLEGAAGLVSTVPDYLRFMQALLNLGELDGARILQADTVREMTRNHLDPALLPISLGPGREMPDRGWGYGLAVVIDREQSAFGVNNGEFGWNGSLGTYSWADPQTGTVAVLMLQIQPSSAGGIAGKFKDLVYNSILP